MSDAYRDFEDLKAHQEEGVDYRIRVDRRSEDVVILAPHGGGIEPGTAPLAREIAGTDYTYYGFEGINPDGGNWCLHLTSTRFDEPVASSLVRMARIAVAVHGARERDGAWVMVGGLDAALVSAISEGLKAAGIQVRACDARRGARERANICNRTARGLGVQLELSATLREHLRENRADRANFVSVVRSAIASQRTAGA